MVNNTRKDSASSHKGFRDILQSKNIQSAVKKINGLGDKTKSMFQSRSDASKAEAKDYSMGERQVGPYGYEKINIEDDGGEIFIFKRPDKMSFDDMDFTPYRMEVGDECGSTDPVPACIDVQPEGPVQASGKITSLDDLYAGHSAPREIKVSTAVINDDGTTTEVDNNLADKLSSSEDIANVGSTPRMGLADDAVAGPAAEAPVEEVPATIAPVAEAGETAGEPAEQDVEADDNYDWFDIEDTEEPASIKVDEPVPMAPAEPVIEQAAAVAAVAAAVASAEQAPAAEAPSEVVAKVPEKIEIPETEVTGIMLDGDKASSGSETDAASVVSEELQAAETCSGATAVQPACNAMLSKEGDGNKYSDLKDPVVRRPRTMRFRNGVLCDNKEPKEELPRPLE